jgi:5-methylcytosine-specific restriction endonuclease McrA
MARLATLAPQLTPLPSALGYLPSDAAAQSRYRRSTQPWQGWYKTARWQRLRWSVLVRDCFTCTRCKRVIVEKGEAICDHVEPHRGDHTRFWAGPFQTLCKQCHDSAKQQAEFAIERGVRP